MFEVGSTVAVFNGSSGRFERLDKVRKVYKNGNVVLEGFKGAAGQIVGDKQQYSGLGDCKHATGDSWMRGFIMPYNEQTKERIQREEADKRLRISRNRLRKIVGEKTFTQDQIDRVMAILEE